MHEILKIHNDLTDLPLKRFTASEIDILHTLCYEVREKGTQEVVIQLSDLKELADYKKKDTKAFIQAVKETNRKLMDLHFELESEDGAKVIQFVLFPTFITDADKGTLTVKVNEPFAYLINKLSGNYTSVQLRESAELKSSYSKQIYKKLSEYKDTGLWRVPLEGFREYLDIPSGYRQTDIDARVIKPALDELGPIWAGLKVEKTYQKSASGKGRPRVVGYEWRWKPTEHAKKEVSQDAIAEATGWESTPRYCPQCKRAVYSKQMHNQNGTYYLYGHTDWRTGPCSFTTTDFSQLLQEYQVAEPEPETEETQANKNRLRGLLSGLFRF